MRRLRLAYLVIPIIVAGAYFIKVWNEQRRAHGTTSKLPDVFIWILMGFGAVFVGRWFMYGTL